MLGREKDFIFFYLQAQWRVYPKNARNVKRDLNVAQAWMGVQAGAEGAQV